ncbi:MAG: hypothetical protein M1820_008992 [Bogoriella megaspora]|nr:MAG: hypothetical protein M1820_008992 [Bogoriella megaspora]
MPPPGRPAPIDPPLLNSFNDPGIPSTPPAWDIFNFNSPSTSRVPYPLDIRVDDLTDGPKSSTNQPEQTDVPDPLTRFYSGRDDPWTPQQSLVPYTMPVPPQRSLPSQSRPAPPDTTLFDHSSAPSSEVGSNVNASCRSDSGYITQAATARSVHSVDSGDTNEQLSSRLDKSQPFRNTSRPSQHSVIQFESNQPQSVTPYPQQATSMLQCKYCGEVPKCRSEYKKHITKHEKPHKCDVPGCPRKEGFTSANDLDRHKKSKHNVKPKHGSDRSYKCAADQCRKKMKIWPRLDNFRQHVVKIHPNDNADILIRKSEELANKVLAESNKANEALTDQAMDPQAVGLNSNDSQQLAPMNYVPPIPTPSRQPSQAPAWPLHSTYGANGVNPPERHHSISQPAMQPASTTYPPSNASARQHWQSTPHLGESSTIDNSRYQNGGGRLDDLARAAVDQWQPNTSPSGNQPNFKNPWPTSAPTAAESSLDADHEQALSVLARKIHENRGSSSKQKAQFLDTVMEVLKVAAASTPDAPQQNGAYPHAARKNSNDPEYAQLQYKLSAMAKLMKEDSQQRPPSNAVRQRPTGSHEGETCRHCYKVLPRNCDMNKHMKRHTRPYGCTFPRCKKRFGSKNDWKRHENSQHFQQETYRCRLPSSSSNPGSRPIECAQVFYCRDTFKTHLATHHRLANSTEIESEAKVRHIGRNGQGRFWCGFCNDVIKLEQRGIDAWDERFKHIGDHFNKEERNIGDWICLETNKPKGVQSKEVDRAHFEYPDADRKGEGFINGEGVDESRKRGREDGLQMSRQETVYFCCRCGYGPYHGGLYQRCVGFGNAGNCDHDFCSNCPVKKMKAGLNENTLLNSAFPPS